MAARRCTTCAAMWPNEARYEKCPVCDTATWHNVGDPMSQSEANHHEFEHAYFPKWDAERLKRERESMALVSLEIPPEGSGQVESD